MGYGESYHDNTDGEQDPVAMALRQLGVLDILQRRNRTYNRAGSRRIVCSTPCRAMVGSDGGVGRMRDAETPHTKVEVGRRSIVTSAARNGQLAASPLPAQQHPLPASTSSIPLNLPS